MTTSPLSERITFLAKMAIPDEMGGRVLRWADAQTIWAAVEPVRYGAVNLDSDRKAPARSVYRVRIRTGNPLPQLEKIGWRGKVMRLLTRPVTLPGNKLIEFQVVEES